METFMASFCAMLAVFRQFLVCWVFWGPSELFGGGGLFGGFEAPFGPVGAYLGLSWRQSSTICVAPGDVGPVGAFWTLFVPLQVVSFPLLDI